MPAILRLSLVLTTFFLSACRPPDTVEVVDSREPFRDDREPAEATEYQRFAENTTQTMFQWTKPQDWRGVKASQFREINFAFGPSSEGECYLTVLAGSGSGVAENFNRWRAQFGMEPMKEGEVAALPTKTFLGRMVPALDISGSYNLGSMSPGGSVPKAEWRLVGVIMEAPGAVITVKMTGPKALIEAEQENLDAFLASVVPAPNLR